MSVYTIKSKTYLSTTGFQQTSITEKRPKTKTSETTNRNKLSQVPNPPFVSFVVFPTTKKNKQTEKTHTYTRSHVTCPSVQSSLTPGASFLVREVEFGDLKTSMEFVVGTRHWDSGFVGLILAHELLKTWQISTDNRFTVLGQVALFGGSGKYVATNGHQKKQEIHIYEAIVMDRIPFTYTWPLILRFNFLTSITHSPLADMKYSYL